MDDDLDTPSALQTLTTLAEAILTHAAARRHIDAAQSTLQTMGKVFGLQLGAKTPEERVVTGWQRHLGSVDIYSAPAGRVKQIVVCYQQRAVKCQHSLAQFQ